MSSQSVIDRLNAAKHSISGQGLAKSVCKATTEEVNGPKRKHLDYLLQCTHEANVSVPQLADLLIQRTQSHNWVVVFKSLITVHNIMNYGNERFMQYMASMTNHTQLDNYNDRTNPGGYDMSTYIRKYAKYINSKSVSYRVMAFDFCKVKRGKDDGLLRTMNPEKLLKSLPALQELIDSLLEFDPTLSELNNGVINGAFLLLFKDLIRLFACYNDGIINLLEKYFDMTRKQCKEGLDIYKKFLVRMDKTAEFLKVAENVGIDKGDIPDLTKAPASLMEALEAHLASLEGKKAAKSSGKPVLGGPSMSEDDKKKILAEEEKELQKLKEQKMKAQAAAGQMSAMQAANASVVQAASAAPPPSSHADDLLGLAENPFQSKVENVLSVQNIAPVAQQPQAVWGSNMQGLTPQNGQQTSGTVFANDTNFAAAFKQPQPAQADLLDIDLTGDILSAEPPTNENTSAGEPEVESAPTTEPKEETTKPKKKKKIRSSSADKSETRTPKKKSRDKPEKTSREDEKPVEDADGVVENGECTVSKEGFMTVVIGGQKVSINTKPNLEAEDSPVETLDTELSKIATVPKTSKSPKSRPKSPAKSPVRSPAKTPTKAPTKRALSPVMVLNPDPVVDLLGGSIEEKQDSAISESSDEEVEPESQSEPVIDLLGGFDTPVVAPTTPVAPAVNNDILDLLGGLSDAEPNPPTSSSGIFHVVWILFVTLFGLLW